MGHYFFSPFEYQCGEHKQPPVCLPTDQVTISIHPAPSNLQFLSNSVQHNYSLSIGLCIKRKLSNSGDSMAVFSCLKLEATNSERKFAMLTSPSTFWKTSVSQMSCHSSKTLHKDGCIMSNYVKIKLLMKQPGLAISYQSQDLSCSCLNIQILKIYIKAAFFSKFQIFCPAYFLLNAQKASNSIW